MIIVIEHGIQVRSGGRRGPEEVRSSEKIGERSLAVPGVKGLLSLGTRDNDLKRGAGGHKVEYLKLR